MRCRSIVLTAFAAASCATLAERAAAVDLLTVIRQNGPDSYELLGTVSTRVGARMMHMDERTGRLFVVAADYTEGKPGADGEAPRTYHPNSFVVLTYKPI